MSPVVKTRPTHLRSTTAGVELRKGTAAQRDGIHFRG